MKFLITKDSGPNFLYKICFTNTLIRMGHEVHMIGDTKGILNEFYYFRPDVFFGSLRELDRATLKGLDKYKSKTVLTYLDGAEVNNANPLYPNVDLVEYCSFMPDCRTDVDLFVANKQTHLLKFAADTYGNQIAELDDNFKSDVLYVGANKPEKADLFDRFLYSLVFPNTELNVKIFGPQPFPCSAYLGVVQDNNLINMFYQNAKITLNLSNSTYINFRVYQVLHLGGIVVSNIVPNTEWVDGVLYVNNSNDIISTIKRLDENPKERQERIGIAREYINNGNTFVDRVKEFGTWIGEQL